MCTYPLTDCYGPILDSTSLVNIRVKFLPRSKLHRSGGVWDVDQPRSISVARTWKIQSDVQDDMQRASCISCPSQPAAVDDSTQLRADDEPNTNPRCNPTACTLTSQIKIWVTSKRNLQYAVFSYMIQDVNLIYLTCRVAQCSVDIYRVGHLTLSQNCLLDGDDTCRYRADQQHVEVADPFR